MRTRRREFHEAEIAHPKEKTASTPARPARPVETVAGSETGRE
jgi:hypothetical protein